MMVLKMAEMKVDYWATHLEQMMAVQKVEQMAVTMVVKWACW